MKLPLHTGAYILVFATMLGSGCASGSTARPAMPGTSGSAFADTLRWAQPLITPSDAPVIDAPDRSVLEVLTGEASYYSDALAGNRTASGERYDPGQLTAAHPSLPFGSMLRVTSLIDGATVEVRVTDRGPFAKGRVLDLSRRAAEQLGMIRRGHIPVLIEVLSHGPA